MSAVSDPVPVDAALAALADPLRRRAVELLALRPHRAGELAGALGVTPPTMSKQLRILRQGGLVTDTQPSFDTRVRVYQCARNRSAICADGWKTPSGAGSSNSEVSLPTSASSMTTERSRVLVAVRVPCGPAEAFDRFTAEIGQWWQPNPLFRFSAGRQGALAFETGKGGRLIETYDDGTVFVIGDSGCVTPTPCPPTLE